MTNSTPSTPPDWDHHGLWHSSDLPSPADRADDVIRALSGTQIGPFEVHDELGRGGMGLVMSGVHRSQDVPVALKFLTHARRADPQVRERLRDEVQAAARLHHPGVVMVFDYGEVELTGDGPETGPNRDGHDRVPFFVMERATRGTLRAGLGRVDWTEAKSILLTLLDALAHAHGTGLVHRDIKPENILLAEWNGRTVPKLGDFGIAFAVEGDASNTRSVGTPRYMAPEQIERPWRDHGPWSDLYAVGCVAYELVVGSPLFDSDDTSEIYRQHFQKRRPDLATDLDLPPGFDDWLQRLLRRPPDRRYQSAAQAARDLSRLDATIASPRTGRTDGIGTRRLTPMLDPVVETDEGRDGGSTSGEAEGGVDEEIPLPESWPPPSVEHRPMRFVGAGLGLYELQSTPLIGRDRELDHLWDRFLEARESGANVGVAIRGREGVGKSKLVESFTRRIRELGAGTVLRATHSESGETGEGLAGMLGRHFRILGASDREAARIIRESMDGDREEGPLDWQTLLRVVRPGHQTSEAATDVQIASPSQRYAAVQRYLAGLARDRPVVVWLDDVQWGRDSLEFADFLQSARPDSAAPILIVATASDEELADRPEERELLDELTSREATSERHLGPLDPVEHERLVEELLYLKGDLAREVVRRTDGNPQFTVELIGDWVDRGVLEPGDRGFVLADDVDPTIPDHLHDVWERRIDTVVGSRGPEARRALELAAALGRDVDLDEWRGVCELADVPFDRSLVGELARRGFAEPYSTGWSFNHAILRQSLERLARDAGRWHRFRRLCAELVSDRYDLKRPRVAERFGEYAKSAGDDERALEPLMRGARGRRRRGEYLTAQQLLDAYLESLESADVAESNRRWGVACIARARCYLNNRQPRRAAEWAERALEGAKHHDWDDLRPQALGWLALAEQWLGDEAAEEDLRRASRALDSIDDQSHTRGVFGSVAHGLTRLGDFEEAARLLDHDRAEAERARDHRALANNLYLRARHAFFREEWEEALHHALEARDRFHELGHLPGETACMEYIAEIHRMEGRDERAESTYRKCLELQKAIGHPRAIGRTNLATLLLARDATDEAEQHFASAAETFETTGRRLFRAVATGGLLACAASDGHAEAAANHLGEIREFVDAHDEAERDLAELLELAGDDLAAHDLDQLALEVYQLAAEQWGRLDDDGAQDRVVGKIETVAGVD